MDKFCGNCGALLDDDARVCGQCGTPVEGKKVISANSIKKKKRLKKILVVCILVLVSLGIFKIVYNYTGVNGFARKVMNAYKDYDIYSLVEMSSDKFFYKDLINDYINDFDNSYDAETYFKDIIGNNFDYYESVMDSGDKIGYKILEHNNLSERKKEIIMDELENQYSDFDSIFIDQLIEVKVKIFLGKGRHVAPNYITLIISKENGSYRLFDIYN